jgi:hypothetical protein
MAKFANFKIIVEIEKLKIHVEGDREVAPEIANNVAHQITTVLQPSGLLEAPKYEQNSNPVNSGLATPRARRTRRPSSSGKTETAAGKGTVDWNHDAAKWGTPVQSWKQWQKILWLLSVVEGEALSSNGLTSSEMADIFKQKFRSSGLLKQGNIPRDLVSKAEYFGSVDDHWFLKQSGKSEAAKLVTEAKGSKASTASA